jgi:hypothetical protein
MAGLLDFLGGGGDPNAPVDPRTIGLLTALGAAGQSMQPTRLPTSGLGNALGVLGAYGQGMQEGQLANTKLGLLNQQARGAQITNDLNQINLDYYRGAQQPTRNPVAGLGGATAGPTPPNGLPAATALYSPGGAPAASPGGSGFLLDPATVLQRAQAYSQVPALKDQALQMLKLYEQMISTGTGATTSGALAPFTGAPESTFAMAHAKSLGETLAGNNKDQIVGPGAAHIPGPRTLAEYQGSLQPGGAARPDYVNPNSPNNIVLNTGKTGAQTAIEAGANNLGEGQKSALAAADLLPTLQRGQALIPQIFAGPGSTVQAELTRLFAPNDPRLAATSEYLRTIGAQVGTLARQVGGTQISDNDRKVAERLAGGDTTITKAELQSVLTAAARAANQTIATHNARVKQFVGSLPADVAPMLSGALTVNPPPGVGAQPSASGAPAAAFQEGQTATNQQTGAKIIFKGGQWVPAQ